MAIILIETVNGTVREYLAELEQENPVEPPVPQQERVSTTDPDSTYATKGGPARLGYYDYTVTPLSGVVLTNSVNVGVGFAVQGAAGAAGAALSAAACLVSSAGGCGAVAA